MANEKDLRARHEHLSALSAPPRDRETLNAFKVTFGDDGIEWVAQH